MASLVAEHGLQGSWASAAVAHRLRFPDGMWDFPVAHRLRFPDGMWDLPVAHRLRFPDGMWDLPASGAGSLSPVLAGRFFITEPPGKPHKGAFH